jgi:hypothetical protein
LTGCSTLAIAACRLAAVGPLTCLDIGEDWTRTARSMKLFKPLDRD